VNDAPTLPHDAASAGPIAYVLGAFPALSETFILNEVDGLLQLGLDLVPLSTARRPAPEQIVHAQGRRLAAQTVYVDGLASVARALRYLAARRPAALAHLLRANWLLPCLPGTPRLKRLLRALFVAHQCGVRRARLVHGHWTVPSDIALMVGDALGLPFSFTAHAHDIFDEGPVYERLRPGFGLAYKIARARVVMTCTAYNRSHLCALCPPSVADRVHTVYHGVDVERFRPRAGAGNGDAPPTLLAVGRLVRYKGFDRLIAICGRLKAEGLRFRCRIVGEGSQRDALQAQITALGLADAVQLLGPKPMEEMPDLYRQADIFVLPASLARGQHGLPNVLVEAMSCGLAAISTALPPVPELIADGDTGLVVPDDDDALYQAVRHLVADSVARRRFGQRARAAVVARFALAANTRRVATLLERAVHGTR
jgi:glycosyltransferase involved in cell wall biosynthesis